MDDKVQAVKAVARICRVIIETVGECPEGLPEGHLYTVLSEYGCTLSQFNQLVGLLVEGGQVRKVGHLLKKA